MPTEEASRKARHSRRKGGVGEREACRLLEELTGVAWKRSAIQSRGGGKEAADIIPDDRDGPVPSSMYDLHIEVKRGKAISLWAALKQAGEDVSASGKGQIPMVLARRDHEVWVVMLKAGDLLRLSRVLRQKTPPPRKKR